MKNAVSIIALATLCYQTAYTQAPAIQQTKMPVMAPANVDGRRTSGAPNTLVDGTPIKLRLAENLSSESNRTGDQVPFEVTEEVLVEGVPVIAKGAQALATITNAESKKRMGRGGKLDVSIESVRLVDGEKAQLRGVKDTKAGGHVGAMTGAIVATSIVFFPAAPLFLFMHGKAVEIPKGTEITAFTQGDMRLDPVKFASAATGLPGQGGQVAPALASLSVDSTPSGADIEIDGNFVGNTPSTVSVAAGKHSVTVKRRGYADWNKTMSLSGSSVHLQADLNAL